MNIFKNKKFLLISGIIVGVIALVTITLVILNSFGISIKELFGAGQEQQEEEAVKVAYLAKGTLVQDDNFKFEIVDQNGKVWIEGKDVENVYISSQKGKDRYLEFALNENGVKKLDEATQNAETVLTLEVNDKVLATPITQDETTESSAVYFGKDIMSCFNVVAVQIFDETASAPQENSTPEESVEEGVEESVTEEASNE